MGLLLATMLLLSAGGSSQGPSPLEGPRKAFWAADFSSALAQLDALLDRTSDEGELAQVHLWRARCFHALGRSERVETALTQALAADPTARLDDQDDPPALRALFDAVKLRLSGTLRLKVRGLAEGDRLEVDGEPLADGVFTKTLAIGEHEVAIRSGGGAERMRRTVRIHPGRASEVELALPGAAPPPPPPPPVVTSPAPQGPASVGLFARLEGRLDPGPQGGALLGAGLGAELGPAVLCVGVVRGAFFGASGRAGLELALVGPLRAGVGAEAFVFFSAPVSVSVGGVGELGVRLPLGLSLWAGGAYAWVPVAPEGFRPRYGLMHLAVRWTPR